MIRSVDIPRDEWPSILTMLDRLANGRPVRLEVKGRELGDLEMANLLPLVEVEVETKGSERGNIIVTVGSDRGELTHLVQAPASLKLGLSDANEPQWVEIKERGEVKTIVHFEQLPALERDYGATL